MWDGADETEPSRVRREAPVLRSPSFPRKPEQMLDVPRGGSLAACRIQEFAGARFVAPPFVRVLGLGLQGKSRANGLPCIAFDEGSRIAPGVVGITGRTGNKEFWKCLHFISS